MNFEDLIKPGAINMINICHDDWCKTLKTGDGNDCNCNPVTRMVPLESEEDIQRYCAGGEE